MSREHDQKTDPLLPLKAIRLLALLTLVAVTLWQCVQNINEFLKHEAVTTISKEMADSIEFPQITICNYNRWKYSLLTPEAIAMAYAAYAKANGQGGQVNATNIDMYNFTYERGWHLVDEYNYDKFGQLRSSTLAKCTFAGEKCNTKFFKHHMTSYGNCYTFNKDLTEKDVNDTETSLPLTQTHASETNGFDAYISIEADDYSEIPEINGSPFLGIKVIVHSKDEQPDPTTSGLSVGPGFYGTIAVQRTEYNNLSPPEGSCDPQRQLVHFDKYTASSCETECKMNLIEQNCSCQPYFYPKLNKSCTFDDTLGCAQRVIAAINRNFSKFCDCPEPCTYEAYTTTISYAPFPNTPYGNVIVSALGLPGISFIQENIVGLRVYFSDISSTVITQSPAHTVVSTLNDVGGASGLYVGFSFLTFVELAQVIAELVTSKFTKSKRSVGSTETSVQSVRKEAFK